MVKSASFSCKLIFLDNINQDKIAILQTDDTMIDFYNIDNDIDKINLLKKRNKMIDECMKRRSKN